MPTNLPPQCKILEKRYFQAETLPEKIKALEEYHSSIPKHKGTERLRGQVKTKLSKLKLEMEKSRRQKSKMSITSGRYSIKKEGAAQVAILGYTTSGKSSILEVLTHAKPQISSYPFTTTEPIPGMMAFEDIQIQLLETPAIFKGASDGKGWGLKTLSLARNADSVILLVDLSTENPCTQLESMINELNSARIRVENDGPKVEIEKRDTGDIQFICLGRFSGDLEEIKRFMKENGINSATVRIWGEVDMEEVAVSLVSGIMYKPSIVVANKIDVEGAKEKIEALRKSFSNRFKIIEVSAKTKIGFEEMPKSIFETLDIIRIYTKRPREKPSKKPFIARGKISVEDLTKIIHSKFSKNFKYARVWGSSKYPGEKVGLKYFLKDRDIVEIHV